MPDSLFSPYFLAYARSRGMEPAKILERDRKVYPGASMTNFTIWIMRRWREWDALTGHKGSHGPAEQQRFEEWLEQRTHHTAAKAARR